MLRNLSIRDVVLVGRLDLTFHGGLCVLTGETGAGKSILLDALGLAMGQRADARLVRPGAAFASVTADFDIPGSNPSANLLAEQGIEPLEDGLILRRTVTADGKSRAFVNDQPVSVSFLRSLGEACVEIHGQFENQRLMRRATHRELMDSYGELNVLLADTREAYRRWARCREALRMAADDMQRTKQEEAFLRHAVDELAALAPQSGEEEALVERRTTMMHREQLVEAVERALVELRAGKGVEGALRSAAKELERIAVKAQGRVDEAVAALDRSVIEASEGLNLLERLESDLDHDADNLEQIEERLFALRAVARKHGVVVDDLTRLQETMTSQLAAIEDSEERLASLEREQAQARQAFEEAALKLSQDRTSVASRLDEAVAAELAPLRLGKAVFRTHIERLEESNWGEQGCDAVTFEVATNPGMPPGPLDRISSGGELARFMLALKVVLAGADAVLTLVFDEVDANVGGAVAAAVGERLARLARERQVLVVTHSPQVAARGEFHLRVEKRDEDGRAVTAVDPLSHEARREEIARMLAGSQVTEEARAAADSLLSG